MGDPGDRGTAGEKGKPVSITLVKPPHIHKSNHSSSKWLRFHLYTCNGRVQSLLLSTGYSRAKRESWWNGEEG